MLGGSTESLQKLAIILGIGGFLGYLIADKYNKSKKLGVVLGAGATLGSMYAFHLNVNDIFSGGKKPNLSLKKPCKKWVQQRCITAPCLPTCAEY
jgi:hypothetical protein